MKKLSFEKFTRLNLSNEASSQIKGGYVFPTWAGNITGGGTYFFGYGDSNSDYSNGNSTQYFFTAYREDGSTYTRTINNQ